MRRPDRDPQFKKISAEPLHEFRGVGPDEKIFLPELPQNRKCTDVCCLGFLVVVVCGWISFSVYVGVNSDIRLLLNGVDSCGNICGVNNKKLKVRTARDHYYDDFRRTGMSCEPEDYTDYPVVLFVINNTTSFEKKCIKAEDCVGNRELRNRRCYPEDPENRLKDAKNDYFWIYKINPVIILIMFLIAIGLNILVIFCFRLDAKITYWTLLTINIFLLLAACVFTWYMAISSDKNLGFKFFAIVITVVLVLYVIYVCFLFRKKHQLIIRLYEETMAAIFNGPVILTVPLLSMLFNAFLNIILVYMSILAFSSRDDSDKNFIVRIIYFLLLLVVYFWMYNITTGCQCTIVASTISSHYFCRNKNELKSPVFRSFKLLIRYHLGSVALGSMIITIISIMRCITEYADRSDTPPVVRCCICACFCLLYCLEDIVRYLSKKAYIMIAIHGRSFYKSALRSIKLMWHFLIDLVVTDLMGPFATYASSALTVLIPLLIGIALGWNLIEEPQYLFLTVLFGCILVLMVTFYYCSLLHVSMETTFLCLCEDRLLNDGSQFRPYFMSARLREMIEDSWERIDKKNEEEEQKREETRRRREAELRQR